MKNRNGVNGVQEYCTH